MESKIPSNKQTVKVLTDRTLYEFLVEYPEARSGDQLVEIIFFHGLQLGDKSLTDPHLTTWSKRSVPNEYWPSELFLVDDFLKRKKIKVRALTAAYDASKIKTRTEGRLDLYLIVENLLQTICSTRVNVGQSEGVPVMLVGHSFGGLVIKKLMDYAAQQARRGSSQKQQVKNFLKNVAGVFYYSTPHLALSEQVHSAVFPPNKENEYSELELFFRELNKDVSRLTERMDKVAANHGEEVPPIKSSSVFEVEETDLGHWKGLILDEGSGRDKAAENSSITDADHLNICKIDSVTSDSYQKLADFMVSLLNPENSKEECITNMMPDVPSNQP